MIKSLLKHWSIIMWSAPTVKEVSVGLEVTSYASADIDLI